MMPTAIAARRGIIVPQLGLRAAWAAIVAGGRGRLALWLPVFMGAGIVGYFSLPAEPARWIGLEIGVPVLLGAILGRGTPVRPLLAPLAAAAIGFAAAQFATARALPAAPLPKRAVIVTATVRAIDMLPVGRRVMLARAQLGDADPIGRTIRVRLRDTDATELHTGDTVRVRALVQPPSPPAYPGGWDLQRDDYFSGLAGYGFALGPAEILAHAPPTGLWAWLRALRETIHARVTAALPGPEGAVAATLLTGLAVTIPEADRAAFRESGLAHLLAVAGLHIGIVMGLFFGLSRRLLALWERAALHWPCKAIAAVVALAAGGAYLLLTGAHVPIIRSFAMAALVTLGVVAGRRAISLRGLGLAAVALMLIAPWQVMGVSFQMSFSAVLALIAGYEALQPRLRAMAGDHGPARRLLMHVVALALTSFLAGTASAPFAAYHFGHFQAYYVLSNLFAVPITAMLVLPAGMAALALMPFGLEQIALTPMGWGVNVILWIARITSAAPEATIAVPHIPGWGLAVVSLGIAWLGLWRGRARFAGAALIAAGLGSAALVRSPDILVSDTAALIGVHARGGLFVQSLHGRNAFVRHAWEQALATGDAQALADAPGIGCGPAGCLFRPSAGSPAALIVRGADALDGCGEAAVLISAEPAHRRCGTLPTIDRFTVWRQGAQAVWLEPGRAPLIVSDRAMRGDRPWVPRPGGDQGRKLLPAAATE